MKCALCKKLVHRVICGDSRLPEVYDAFLKEIIRFSLTDPPLHNELYRRYKKDKLQIENDNMTSADFFTFFWIL
jgi:hypothetical protein